MKKQAITVIVVVVTMQVVSTANAASFQGVGDLPGGLFSSSASSVSADGSTVVGRSATASTFYEAFRWTASEGIQSLGFLPGGESRQSHAYGISADGSVVVGYGSSAEGNQAFRWTESGGLEGLGDLPGGLFSSCACAVSADGSMVVGEGRPALVGLEAFRWTAADGMVGLGDLPGGSFNSSARGISADGSVIAGYGRSETAWQAFRWTQETGMVGLGDLPGGNTFSTVQDLSADGTAIVGWSSSYSSAYEAYLWTESGGWRGLGDWAGGDFYSEALGVSADGSVVVGYGTTASGPRAFIWDENNGMRYLKNVLENNYGLDLTGWTLNWATSISDDGLTIVGWGSNPQGASEAWIARLAELVALEIVGPNEMAENFSAGYQAIAYYDNNSTMDVTDLAQWSVEPNAIASISAGLLTTAEIGSQEEDLTIYCQYVEAAATVTAEQPVRVFAVCLGASALYFDGVDDCVATSLEIDQSGSSDMTMVAWVYPTATSPYRQQVISSDNGGFDWSLLKRHGTWRVFTGDGSWNSGFSVDINAWQHVAAVFRAGQDVISYKDGVSRSRGSAPDIDISDNPVAIGDNPGRWDEHFEGKIDEVRVYDRALTAEEIWENMHRKLSGEEPNLIGYWDFDEGEGQFAYDLSGKGNHGWLGWTPFVDNRDPAWVEPGAPVGTCAIPVAVDIKAGICPNPVNVRSRGVLSAAILGSEEFDVNAVDPASIKLAGVSAIRSGMEDVASPVTDGNECDCNDEGPDGYADLKLKFGTQEILEAVGEVNDGDTLPLSLTGALADGTLIEGMDCIVVRGKYKPFNKADLNKDGIVNVFDFALLAENWLQLSIEED